MGCSNSKPSLLANTKGDGKSFLNEYSLHEILGQGEFGVVKLAYPKQQNVNDASNKNNNSNKNNKEQQQQQRYACKILRKGIQFKDNTLYSAIKPHVLQSECGILQLLREKRHILQVVDIYESPSSIYILTEYLSGGDMFQYVSMYYNDGGGLRTEDVSRMSFQLLDAVSHCAKHGIIHRDIKPENIMFEKGERGSSLKLIDFGSGTFCAAYNHNTSTATTNNTTNNASGRTPSSSASSSRSSTKKSKMHSYDLNNPLEPLPLPSTSYSSSNGNRSNKSSRSNSNSNHNNNNNIPNERTKIKNDYGDELHLHTTFAGSAFYISPEMFRKHYTLLTDVWSVGVTLYVLVAGYPADALQEAFNKLQSKNEKSIEILKALPNMPSNMPDSYYEMLDLCLTYKHRARKGAGDILHKCEFVNFYKEHSKSCSQKKSNRTNNCFGPATDDTHQHNTTTTNSSTTNSNTVNVNVNRSRRRDRIRIRNNNNDDDDDEPQDDEEQEGGISLNQVISDATNSRNRKKTKSMLIQGSVSRHTKMLKYGQFERSLTSLLASMLDPSDLKLLLNYIDQVIDLQVKEKEKYDHPYNGNDNDNNEDEDEKRIKQEQRNRKRLQIIKIGELHTILKNLEFNQVLDNIYAISDDINYYNKFAYHVAFLRQFDIVPVNNNVPLSNNTTSRNTNANVTTNVTNELDNSMSRKLKNSLASRAAMNSTSKTSNKRASTQTDPDLSDECGGDEECDVKKSSSIHNGNAWDMVSKRFKKQQQTRRLSF